MSFPTPKSIVDGEVEKISEGMRAVAQTLINIHEGIGNTIERGSRLEKGMTLLMDPVIAAQVNNAPRLRRALEVLLYSVMRGDETESSARNAAIKQAQEALKPLET
jgi:hypothetical protein